MRRVLVLGCPGSGKSMATRQLSAITGLPVIHLDQHYWLPGWRRPDSAAWTKIVGDLADQSAWIMDGNYSGTLEQRLRRADTLIHLDYPTWLFLWRAVLRALRAGAETETVNSPRDVRNALMGRFSALCSITAKPIVNGIWLACRPSQARHFALPHQPPCQTLWFCSHR